MGGEKIGGGVVLDKSARMNVYSGMFQTAYLNASISEDEAISSPSMPSASSGDGLPGLAHIEKVKDLWGQLAT